MTNVDQFESVFRSASKDVFEHATIEVPSILVVTDQDEYATSLFTDGVRRFLRVLDQPQPPRWSELPGSSFRTVRELLDRVEGERPDLICTYRHLRTEGWRWPFTLGDHLEVLTQATSTPVLVLPHPRRQESAEGAIPEQPVRVMAITDHLTGDDRLVNVATRFTAPGGVLMLTHVEDELVFERYMETIGKIPTLDTDVARATVPQQLIKEPTDYIESCRRALAAAGVELKVETIVTLGHRLTEYRGLIEEHDVDLLVFNTKDDDQVAMHGLAYALAVELLDTPLLML